MTRRRRCSACHEMVWDGILRVYDGDKHLDYFPGYQPRGMRCVFLCDECKVDWEVTIP